MRTNFKRGLAALAAMAAASGVLVTAASTTVSADPPGTPPDGGITLTPTSGAVSDPITLAPDPIPANCDGDTAVDGYRWNMFISDVRNDPATLDYSSATVDVDGGPGVGFTAPLLTSLGSPVLARNTAADTGQIVGIPVASLGFYGAFLVDGEYNIGFACTLNGETTNYWVTSITVSNGGTDFAEGARPAAPVLDSITPGDAQITANFSAGVANPPVTSFTATATPQGGGAAVTASGAGSPITIPGLTNGTTYDVFVTADNPVGTSDQSNTLSGTPALQGQPPVQNLSAVSAAEACTVTWLAPASGPTPTDYTVDVTQGGTPITGSPFTVTSPLSLDLTGLTSGLSYDISVIANYPAPDFGTAASTSCVPTSSQFIVQQVSVTRPPGALILTQRCGVFGDLPAFTGVNDFPGFVGGQGPDAVELGAETAAGFPGTAPTLDAAGTTPDPEFGEYPAPSPASYPTFCDLDLGTASLVTSGNLAGFYEADGRLNQVSVLDTRDGDLGWTLNGEMSAFDDGFGQTFEGSYLGWDPVVTDVTVTPAYTQVVTAGAQVLPGTGIPGDSGLGDGEVLASANAGEGLGVAILDARILLLIPPTVPAGDYDGDLVLSFL